MGTFSHLRSVSSTDSCSSSDLVHFERHESVEETDRRCENVPIAQSIERARPKRQVVGESPAGDTTIKFQEPSSKFQINSNVQNSRAPTSAVSTDPALRLRRLRFEAYLVFGTWCLALISVPVV